MCMKIIEKKTQFNRIKLKLQKNIHILTVHDIIITLSHVINFPSFRSSCISPVLICLYHKHWDTVVWTYIHAVVTVIVIVIVISIISIIAIAWILMAYIVTLGRHSIQIHWFWCGVVWCNGAVNWEGANFLLFIRINYKDVVLISFFYFRPFLSFHLFHKHNIMLIHLCYVLLCVENDFVTHNLSHISISFSVALCCVCIWIENRGNKEKN